MIEGFGNDRECISREREKERVMMHEETIAVGSINSKNLKKRGVLEVNSTSGFLEGKKVRTYLSYLILYSSFMHRAFGLVV